MDELLKLLKAYLVAFMGHPNRKEALDQLHKEAQPIAQHFIDMGHGIERENSKTAITAAERERDDAKAALATANATIETLKKDKPDIAALETTHAQALQKQRDDFDTERKALKAQIRQGYLDRDVAKMRSKMIEKKVSPAIADVLLESKDLLDRIKHDEKGATTVHQAGTRTPFTVAEGQDVFDAVVESELLKKVPQGGFTEEVDEGVGSDGHGHQSATPTGRNATKETRAKKFDTIRKAGEDRSKAAQDANLVQKRQQKLKGTAPAR